MPEDRENFGVKTLDQHWRMAGESGEKERKDRKGMLRAR